MATLRRALAWRFAPLAGVFLIGSSAAQAPLVNDFVPDSTFSADGAQLVSSPGNASDGALTLVRATNYYWMAGSTIAGNQTVSQAQLLADFGVPVVFGTNGHLVTGLAGGAYPSSFLDSQGRLVTVVVQPFGVARFLASGALDTSFSGDGTWYPDGGELVHDVALGPNDSVWVTLRLPQFVNAVLMQLQSNGTPSSYVAHGALGNPNRLGFTAFGYSRLHRNADGSFWWTPHGTSAEGLRQYVVRFTPTGEVDTSYAGDGIAVLPYGCGLTGFNTGYTSMTVLPGNTVVVRSDNPGAPGAWMVAARPDGTPGPARCEPESGVLTSTYELAGRDATRFFGAGDLCDGDRCAAVLRRFLVQPDGSIVDDPAFDQSSATRSFATTDGSRQSAFAFDVIVDQGKPVLVGVVRRSATDNDMLVLRFGGNNFVFDNGFE